MTFRTIDSLIAWAIVFDGLACADLRTGEAYSYLGVSRRPSRLESKGKEGRELHSNEQGGMQEQDKRNVGETRKVQIKLKLGE